MIPGHNPSLWGNHSGRSLRQLVTTHSLSRAERTNASYSFGSLYSYMVQAPNQGMVSPMVDCVLPNQLMQSRQSPIDTPTGHPDLNNPYLRLWGALGRIKLTIITNHHIRSGNRWKESLQAGIIISILSLPRNVWMSASEMGSEEKVYSFHLVWHRADVPNIYIWSVYLW